SSVLQQASMANPNNTALLGAYGRALADVGNYSQALDVLSRAHTPDQPDWRVLSAQGAVLDQMGHHEDAQRYYSSALKIVPDEPSVLSNLGLSYALAKDLPKAEATLRRAVGRPGADRRVRQNLALVVGLQGRFPEAEGIARADLPPDEAAANVAYLKQMMAQQNGWRQTGDAAKPSVKAQGSESGLVHQAHLRHPDRGGTKDDDEQRRQEEQDHRHSQLGRQAGGLLFRFRHAHVAILLRHHAQGLCHRRAVALRLLQRHADRFHAVQIGA